MDCASIFELVPGAKALFAFGKDEMDHESIFQTNAFRSHG